MSIFRILPIAGALTLVGAMSAFVTPGQAALHPNAINLNALASNALSMNASTSNALSGGAPAADDAWQLSPRGATLPSGRAFLARSVTGTGRRSRTRSPQSRGVLTSPGASGEPKAVRGRAAAIHATLATMSGYQRHDGIG